MSLIREEIWQNAHLMQPWLKEIRRDFHQHPELGLEEYRTRDQIIGYLEQLHIPYQVVADTGVVGLITGSKPGKTVALRGDMDALPITEENDLPYRSRNEGKMHACGHDAHMTVLLGAARLLQERKDQLAGQVKLLFQPAEETVGGAKLMIEAGVLDNPRVDAAFGLHVLPDLPIGQISVTYGQVNAASDTLHLTIRGEKGHGAYPHLGRDAIVIAAQVVMALQTIVSRNVDPRQSAVLSLGVIEGGAQHNIIAGEVRLTGTIRTLDAQVRQFVKERIVEVATLTARSLGGEADVRIEEGYTSLINDDASVDLVKQCGAQMLGAENVIIERVPSMGVEDFAFFAEQVPAAFYGLGCRNEQQGIIYPLHHPRFQIDERCLAIGAALQAYHALTFLRSADQRP
ncbi:M20 family metallopeptidase [Brevibacillus humidisoli]|uniref:M20 metallopeptidase family protein n=1 Tax=Brevibacillus humidisoli TaxID=2895522 RepID=UPI001E518242|nr:M20 family metallopeptidase [Brevibacillus humidisoli]UFJ41492.1 M20 family metallopeptidase [Brevibacillus humidisoli]